jgi:hypothetical protein
MHDLEHELRALGQHNVRVVRDLVKSAPASRASRSALALATGSARDEPAATWSATAATAAAGSRSTTATTTPGSSITPGCQSGHWLPSAGHHASDPGYCPTADRRPRSSCSRTSPRASATRRRSAVASDHDIAVRRRRVERGARRRLRRLAFQHDVDAPHGARRLQRRRPRPLARHPLPPRQVGMDLTVDQLRLLALGVASDALADRQLPPRSRSATARARRGASVEARRGRLLTRTLD